MTAVVLTLALAVAGGVGAVCRVLVDDAVRDHWRGPVGIALVNVTGSFALGLVHGAWVTDAPQVVLVLGTGFLGGYTTFSTAMIDVVDLLRAGRVGGAALTALGTVVLSVAAAAVGILTGSVLVA